jgi:hypothetical protein
VGKSEDFGLDFIAHFISLELTVSLRSVALVVVVLHNARYTNKIIRIRIATSFYGYTVGMHWAIL